MYQAKVLDNDNPVAILRSFSENFTTMQGLIDVSRMEAYVVSFLGEGLGREGSNIATIAGGSPQALRIVRDELTRLIDESEKQAVYEQELKQPSYGDLSNVPTALLVRILQARQAEAELRAEAEFEARGGYDDYFVGFNEPPSIEVEPEPAAPPVPEFLQHIAEASGLRIIPNPHDGGPNPRCADYPNCNCGPAGAS